MYVEITSTATTPSKDSRLAFQDLTVEEAEIVTEALVVYKSKLDAEEFKDTRKSCIEMFNQIDSELLILRS